MDFCFNSQSECVLKIGFSQSKMSETTSLHDNIVISMDDQSEELGALPSWSKGSFLTSCQEEEMAATILPVYDPALFARKDRLEDLRNQKKVPVLGNISRQTFANLTAVVMLLGLGLLTLGFFAYVNR